MASFALSVKKERFDRREQTLWGFPGSPVVENPLASAGDAEAEALIPGSGRCSLLQCSCRGIPGTEEPGRLQSTGSQRVRHDLATKQSSVYLRVLK